MSLLNLCLLSKGEIIFLLPPGIPIKHGYFSKYPSKVQEDCGIPSSACLPLEFRSSLLEHAYCCIPTVEYPVFFRQDLICCLLFHRATTLYSKMSQHIFRRNTCIWCDLWDVPHSPIMWECMWEVCGEGWDARLYLNKSACLEKTTNCKLLLLNASFFFYT